MMDKSTCCVLLIAALVCAARAQDEDPMTLTRFGPPAYEVAEGTNFTLRCQINRKLMIILKYELQFVHVSDYHEPKEMILTEQAKLVSPEAKDHYTVNINEDKPSELDFNLTVLSARPFDDGKFLCRVVPISDDGTGETLENEFSVVVFSDVQRVELKVEGQEQPIVGEDSPTMEMEQGHYSVSCHAFGFSPRATVTILLDGEQPDKMQTAEEPVADDDFSTAAQGLRYHTDATVPKLLLKGSNDRLSCEAVASFDGAQKMTVSAPLQIISFEPEIMCQSNASYYVNDKYVKLSCMVDHSMVDVANYSFEIAETGEVITKEMSQNYHQVYITELGGGKSSVTLELYKAEDKHFNTVFYLDIVTKSGQKFREPAKLIKLESTGGSGIVGAPGAAVLLVTVLSLLLAV